jgi:galactokinase
MGSRGWRDYVRGVAWALQDENFDLRGADLVISGDVPPGAGLSSSAAIELGTSGALLSVAEIEVDRRRLALICQKAENMFVGVQCGIMDQYTSALGEEGAALLIDCRSLGAETVALPRGVSLVVVDSKVPRDLAETAYNQRRAECAAAAQALGVESLRDADEDRLEAARSRMSDALHRRGRNVNRENDRVLETASALCEGRLQRVAELMADSHTSLREDFEVSTPELDALVDIASYSDGVVGARLTGAGFGGCTINLVMEDAVDDFSGNVVEAYKLKTGLVAEVHVCRAVSGLHVRHV